MAIRVNCRVSRPHLLLLAIATYSMVLSLMYMSYIYYHDWEVVTYPSSPFQKGMRKWTYSSISRSFFEEFKHALGLGGQATTSRPGVRFDVFHEGYRDMTYQPLKLSCSKCAIVSSSGHLINTSAGAEIDSIPCIFRMNNAPTLGYEKDVGSRTTVRSMGHVNLIKSFEKSSKNRYEMFSDNRTRTEIVLINWMNTVHVDVYSDQEYRYAILLAHLYPEVHFYAFTPDKMNFTQELFKNETGIYSFEANTWLSTGWFTMVAAMDMCDEIVVYGMAHEDFCQNATSAVQSVPYHYYEPDKLKECQYYNKSETRLTGGHLFITEKAVFANWAAQHQQIKFKYPEWPLKNTTNYLDTPFLSKFWAFIKDGGDLSELKKKKAPPKKITHRSRRRRRRRRKDKSVIVTLQKGNETIKVNQDDLVDTLVELLPDVKLIQTDEDVEHGNSKPGDKYERIRSVEKIQNITSNDVHNRVKITPWDDVDGGRGGFVYRTDQRHMEVRLNDDINVENEQFYDANKRPQDKWNGDTNVVVDHDMHRKHDFARKDVNDNYNGASVQEEIDDVSVNRERTFEHHVKDGKNRENPRRKPRQGA